MGLLGFGIVALVIESIFSFWQHNYSFEFITDEFVGQHIIRLILAYPAGLLWGWLMWNLAQWRYTRNK